MPRVLIVAPAFPPHPSPATHRARFLAKYAPEFGWAAEVLTVDPRDYREDLDWELASLIPNTLPVQRVRAIPSRLTAPFGVTDLGIRAYLGLRRALNLQLRHRRPDLVFIPGGPFYPFMLGPHMRARYGVPYVLDFTDPWVYSLSARQKRWSSKAYWSNRLASWLEPNTVRQAAHIVSVSEGTNEGIRARYHDIPAERFTAAPFGFESADYDAVRAAPRPHRLWDPADGNVHLVYVGAMPPRGYETLRALFAALTSLRASDPIKYGRVRMHFIGTSYAVNPRDALILPVAREMGLGAVVSEHASRIPYLDALRVLTSASGLLALGTSERHYTASKIFPYLLARRPVLGIYHEASSVVDIMRKAQAGELVTFGDDGPWGSRVANIAAALERIIGTAGTTTCPRMSALEEYSSRAMSGRLVRIFDAIVAAAGQSAPRPDDGPHA